MGEEHQTDGEGDENTSTVRTLLRTEARLVSMRSRRATSSRVDSASAVSSSPSRCPLD